MRYDQVPIKAPELRVIALARRQISKPSTPGSIRSSTRASQPPRSNCSSP